MTPRTGVSREGPPTLPDMDQRTPVVVAARRTPIGTVGRSLARSDAAGLAGPVLAALAEDLENTAAGDGEGVPVDDVVLGNCCGPGGDVARVAALAAGLGTEVTGVTVDRQCGSGLEAVRQAAALVRAGEAGLVLAGGVESASTAPWRLARPDSPGGLPRPYERAPFTPAGFPDPEMGEAAEALAAAHGIDRDRQDRYAARSHALAVASADAGLFVAELVPVAGVSVDDRPRRGLSARALARFRPAFVAGGTVTAGNSCGINDGAGAVAIVPEELRAALGLPGLAVRATAVVGVDPAQPGIGAARAARAVCDRAGVSLDEVGVIELVEAFAAQVLACTDDLGLDPLGDDGHRVCPQGGAIALGHPWGASGALLLVRLFSTLVRPDPRRTRRATGRYGLATCAVGGGQGVAVLVERVG